MRQLAQVVPPAEVLAVLELLEDDRSASAESATTHWNGKVDRSSRPSRPWLADRHHNKCAFCESTFGHVGFNNTEHFAPKQYLPAWTYEWRNLLLCCQVCNTKKAQSVGIAIHPVYEDPAVHFGWAVGHIAERSERGLDCWKKL